jgi:hypothetical protein
MLEEPFGPFQVAARRVFQDGIQTAAAEVCRIMMGVVMGEEIYASRQIDAVKMMAHLHMHKAWERQMVFSLKGEI